MVRKREAMKRRRTPGRPFKKIKFSERIQTTLPPEILRIVEEQAMRKAELQGVSGYLRDLLFQDLMKDGLLTEKEKERLFSK